MKPPDTLLDKEKIRFLHELGATSPDFFERLTETFQNCGKEILEALEQATTDATALASLGHKLKGMSGNIGATKLEGIALAIERAGHERNFAGILPLIDDAKRTFSATREALARHL